MPFKRATNCANAPSTKHIISQTGANVNPVFHFFSHFLCPLCACPASRTGRKRLFPTANLVPEPHIIVPKRGVYATRAYLPDGTQRVGVTNVGVRPTVSDANRVTVETYLTGFDGDLYGQELRLEFCAYLRPEKKFPSTRELHDQIAENIREAASLVSLTEQHGKTDK